MGGLVFCAGSMCDVDKSGFFVRPTRMVFRWCHFFALTNSGTKKTKSVLQKWVGPRASVLIELEIVAAMTAAGVVPAVLVVVVLSAVKVKLVVIAVVVMVVGNGGGEYAGRSAVAAGIEFVVAVR